MTRRPFRPTEVDDFGGDLEPTITDLERYLADSAADPSSGFADRVMHEIAREPTPRRGVLASIITAFSSERGRVALVAATIAAAILAVVAAGQLSRLMPSQVGGSPSPTISTPSIAPSVPPSRQPSPSTEPSAEPSSTPSDEEESESPRASDEDDDSPSPSETSGESDDNSGPGGGGDDGGNSGPGGGSEEPRAEGD
ncbi:MAG TPA: hypothetical protein VFH90_07010 [Candidatus Limnocylindria bacterium]|nr:hypothetical protein [Candidatus Limnocylindria bacterium]